MATRKKTLDFEASINELESLVEALEEGSLSLEESLKTFEKGVRITRECQQALKTAEQKVTLLMQESGGTLREDSFSDDDSEQQ